MPEDQVQGITEANPQDQLKVAEQVRDLFARAHDYIAQAQYPGHMGMKIAEVLNFLAFHHADFKRRVETLTPKSVESKVDVPAAQAIVDATLAQPSQVQSTETVNE